jgi:hypothetical protein
MINFGRIRWVGHGAQMMVCKAWRRRPFERSRHRWGIILKCNEIGGCGLDTSGGGYGPMAGCCEHDNELGTSRLAKQLLAYQERIYSIELLISLLNLYTACCISYEIVCFIFCLGFWHLLFILWVLNSVKISEWLYEAWSQNWIGFISVRYVRKRFTAIICVHANVSMLETETWLECWKLPAG